MRLPFTVLVAVALCLALCASIASADDTLYACQNRRSTQFRFVADLSSCSRGEDPVTLTSAYNPSFNLGVYDATSWTVATSYPNEAYIIACGLVVHYIDGRPDGGISGYLDLHTTDYQCSGQTPVKVLANVHTYTNGVILTCVDPADGTSAAPSYVEFVCRLDSKGAF
jgi:hypothetical protein